MSHSRPSRTAAMPLRHGSMKLIIPEDGPCHPIVGGSYQQQREHQIDVAIKIITGPHRCFSGLAMNMFPDLAFWGRETQQDVSNDASATDAQRSAIRSDTNQDGHEHSEVHGQVPMLVQLLRIFPIGKEIISTLWSIDTPAVGNLATASKGTSEAVAIYISRFHLPSGDFQDCDWLPSLLENMTAERLATIGIGSHLFVRGKDEYSPVTAIKGVPETWTSAGRRHEMWDLAQLHKNQTASYLLFWPYIMSEETLSLQEYHLKVKFDDYDIPNDERDISYRHLREMSYNIPMLRALSQYGKNLTGIRLHEVPMLDVRVVSLILSVCPSLETMSLVKCELLHFNAIIPLLDVINWSSKKMEKTSVLLDFCPATYFGLSSYGQGTHIISWDGLDMGALGPAVFTTVLLAVLKALPMGIDLLGQGRLFRKFLDLVPMKPGASATFVHHLCCYLDSLADPSIPEEERDGLENQVLLSVYEGTDRKFKYRDRDVAFQSYDCCRCGLSMISGLFDGSQTARPNDQRTCRVCLLDYELEGQEHHRLQKKRRLLDALLRNKANIAVTNQNPAKIQVPEEDLAHIKAPVKENRFISGPAPDSIHRHKACMKISNAITAEDFIAEERDLDVLSVAGTAALLDLHSKMSELDGIDLDHATHRKRARSSGKYFQQTWESVIWDEMNEHRNKTEQNKDAKPAGFW